MNSKDNQFEARIIDQIEKTANTDIDYSNKSPLEVAKKVFHFQGFKENGQKEIIDYILNKKGNAMGIMPTGGGKSACFQIPSLIQENMTIIVSPLISLMKDQVGSLVDKGIHSAFFINSSISVELREKILGMVKENKVKMLYIAPESLQSEIIQDILSEIKIDLMVIDEAHCISTWGHNFRPDYLKLVKIREKIGNPLTLALTATATKEVIIDIQKQLNIKCKVFKASFDRPLLYLISHRLPDNVNKQAFLLDLMKKIEGPTIIFVRTRDLAENISRYLRKNGVESLFYHAGLTSEEREEKQDLFMSGKCETIVATIAFGMGIDKENIRNVIHYNTPQSVENYYQEIGRAGRDGNKSNCILLYTEGDVNNIKTLIASDWPNKEKIDELVDYLRNREDNIVFTSAKSLEYVLGIKEIPIKLILYQLEKSNAIKMYSRLLYEAKVLFKNSPKFIIESYSDDEEIKLFLNSEHLRKIRSIINFERIMYETGLNYFKILEIFKRLQKDGHIVKVGEKYKDLIFLNNKIKNFNTGPIDELFKKILENNQNKVDEIVKCMCAPDCLRKRVLEYFDEPNLKDNCEMCSNCINFSTIENIPHKINKNHASDEDIEEIYHDLKIDHDKEELHFLLMKLIVLDRIIPAKNLCDLLKEKLHRLSAKWKFKLNSYGALKDGDENEIDSTINMLRSDELIEITPEGILRITKKGIKLLEKS
jgi:ATP-dependent DNA helicase RecQ